MSREYFNIVKHYESCFDRFGDNHKGVDWPKAEDAERRYSVMLDVLPSSAKTCSVLDFGCGLAHLFEFIEKNGYKNINYSGLDISEKFVKASQVKFPKQKFYYVDILDEIQRRQLPEFDYIVLNGVFTEKIDLSYDTMLSYFKEMVRVVYSKCRKGIAFNVMSKQVDWEREDLFHLSLDVVAKFLCTNLSRNFVIRNDYGLYEYTVYLYK